MQARIFLALVGFGLGTQAAIADDNRWYATADFGLGAAGSSTLLFSDGSNEQSATTDFSASFAGGGSLGYRFDNGWALEADVMYRRNEMDPVEVADLGSFDEGDLASLSLGLNVLYHFELPALPKVNAYAGAGLVRIEEVDIDFDSAGAQEISFETSDSAWQLKLGATYHVSDRWFIDGGLKYLDAGTVRMVQPSDPTQSISADYSHVTASVGVGIRF